jgi:hypothetical protein
MTCKVRIWDSLVYLALQDSEIRRQILASRASVG